MNLLKLSWKNLTNKPLSLALSLILFSLGVGLISLLWLLNTQLDEKFEKNLANIDIVLGAKGSPLQLILCNIYHVDNPTGNIPLKEARPFLNPKHPLIELSVPLSLGDSYKAHRIVGTTHDYPTKIYPMELAEGRLWEEDLEVTIGALVAERLGLKIGDQFFSSHGLNDDDIMIHDEVDAFKVVGIFKPNGAVIDQLILTNTQSIWYVHEHEGGEGNHHEEDTTANDIPHYTNESLLNEMDQDITSMLIRFKNKKSIPALNFPRNINENTNMQAASPAYQRARLTMMMGAGEKALRALAIVIVVVSGLSIFIALFNSLKDRKYELALMRVMGSSRGYLFMLIIVEGLIIAFLGFLIGLLIGHIGMEVLSYVMEDSYRYSFTGWTFLPRELLLLAGALVIGFIAAVLPALQAYRTDISRTLTDN